MKRFYEDKVVPVGQPSQKRWVLACLCRLGFNPWGGWMQGSEVDVPQWLLPLSCLSVLQVHPLLQWAPLWQYQDEQQAPLPPPCHHARHPQL